MEAKVLYQRLDEEFELEQMIEDWSKMECNEYICENFKLRYMGLVLDNAQMITRVFTAVFPSDRVLQRILDMGETDVLLFTHHPMTWLSTADTVHFLNMPGALLTRLKERRISLYTLHLPLDKVGSYSTGTTLAKAIDVMPETECYHYQGVYVGILGKTELTTVSDLARKVESAVGHRVKIWNYGTKEIREQRVALVAGGGNDPEIILELAEASVNTYVTGITKKSPGFQPSLDFHKEAKKEQINVIAATHYSTEKFACIAILDYFENQGLKGEFIADIPLLTDLE